MAAPFAVSSPLCGASGAPDGGVACDPDHGNCAAPLPADSGQAELDAGGYLAADAGVNLAAAFACHVTAVRAEAGAASGVLVCSAAGAGRNEATCAASSDCAPGFECVVNADRSPSDGSTTGGVCRHYCCDDSCPGARSFCDIETTVGGSVAVPVCVDCAGADAGAPCQLLDDATCGAGGLTCQVVNRSTGQVACVTPGTATVGASCETTNCAKGLSCISGFFPNRTCAELCNNEEDDCPKGETCMPSTVLSSVSSQIGVCGP